LVYQLRDQFPDGVLWARLDTSDSLSILGTFADAYGKDVTQYKDVESRASIVRNLLAEKRTLIVLDNVETSAQIRPLLPPSSGTCAVIITTRHDLSILDGWKRITLEPFDTASDEALLLFERYLGRKFVQVHRISLLEISALLGYLPLALAIAASRMANETSSFSGDSKREVRIVTTMLHTLRISSTRLNTLARDDMGIRSSFDISYSALPPFQQYLFSTLGIFSGEDFGSDAVGYLTDQTPDQADTELGHLHSLSLVQISRTGRWRLHPLLQDYAREKLETTNRMPIVVEKMLLMYQQSARVEWNFDSSLHTEIPNIRFALDQAYQLKLYQPFIQTARAIYPTLYNGAWYSLANTVLEQARQAAHELNDIDADIYFVKGIANMQMGLGDIKNSRENLHLALQLAQSVNREEDIADIYMSMGKLEMESGYWEHAQIYYEKCLALARKINARQTIGMVINNIAMCLLREARYVEAEAMFHESLAIVREYDNAEAIINALVNLGDVANFQDHWEHAFVYWQEGLSLARTYNHRFQASALLANLALIHAQWSEWDKANRSAEEAVQLVQEINSPHMEGAVRSEYGNILYKQKKHDAALEQLGLAKELAVVAGDVERKGLTLFYQGLVYLDLMRLEEAAIVLDEAVNIAKQINYEVLVADIHFVQAKVWFVRKDLLKANQFAVDAVHINERLGLTQKLEIVAEWQKTNGIIPNTHNDTESTTLL